jgi:inosine/guanosine/xanthosine phosphorylase family protein
MSAPDPHPPWQQAASRLAARFGPPPVAAIILGSGAGGLLDARAEGDAVPYPELGLPGTSVAGHRGRMALGRMGGRPVALLAGRTHLYEGGPIDEVVRTVRALSAWGVRRLLLTSAVGGLHLHLPPGSLVRITDHINLSGRNPLVGPNDDRLGPRFPDLARAYDPDTGALADRLAVELGVPLHRGVYVGVMGPHYETAAEIRAFALLGGSVVGMSLVHEVVAAAHAGMSVTAFGVVSNLACGLSEAPLDHDDVQRVVGAATAELGRLLEGMVSSW